MVRAGAGSQNKTCVLLLGHGGEGIWGKNVGFDSLKGQIEPQLQIDVEGPETSENLTQSFIHNIISNDSVGFSDVSDSSTSTSI